ncbi:hypothetical protein EON81_00395 [bacterium]|nr:MAG: hypothetical protein EON81_00395 [bacterium]
MTDPHLTHTEDEGVLEKKFAKYVPGSLFVGVIASLAFFASILLTTDQHVLTQLVGSWMYGWTFWMTITFSMFGLTMLHHAVRGQWTLSILRFLEAGGGWKALVTMGALFVPIVISMILHKGHLYHWADPDAVKHDHVLQWKSAYLNIPGFISRTVIFIGMWAALAWGMKNSVKKQERSGEFKYEAGRSSWGAVGLVFFVLSVTFAMTDWVMSMEPHWSSTMFGPWTLMGGVGAALALCILLLCNNAKTAPFNGVVFPGLTKDLGNMLFAFTMLWGYTSVSQYLIIWNGNLPETTSYFAKRSSMNFPAGMEANNWGALGLALIIGRFFVPWFWLLAPRTKRTPEALRRVCGWVLVMHVLDVYMLVVPATGDRVKLGPIQIGNNALDIVALFVIGLVWWGIFSLHLSKFPFLARYDSRLQEAKAHAH